MSIYFKRLREAVLFSLFYLTVAATVSSCLPHKEQTINPERPAYPVRCQGKTFYVELADTYERMCLGLMYRKRLRANHGMIFFFQPPRRASFWMKNTAIPLSVAFLDSEAVIMEIRHLEPFDKTLVFSTSSQVSYAIEMERGWFDENNITVGSKVDLSSLPQIPLLSPQQQ